MGVQILVNFDNPSSTFRPGEVVTGNVTINTSSKVVATGLSIAFHGEGSVYWSQTERLNRQHPSPFDHHGHGHHQPTHLDGIAHQPSIHGHHHHHHHQHPEDQAISYARKEYRNQETYINSIIALPLGMSFENSTGNAIELQPGYYQSIPFSFQLPVSIPSSCKLAHGKVFYFAEASLKIQRSLLVFTTETRESAKKDFTVLGTLDLTLVNDVLSPVHLQARKNFNRACCCCFSSGDDGEFLMELRLAKTGFIAGEPIIFHLSFVNGSDVTIEEIKAYLDQKIQFITFGKEKVEQSRVSNAVYNTRVMPKTNGSWNHKLMIPPGTYLSDLGGCRIIHIKYMLTVKAKASFWRKSKIDVPITIGTV